jgi:hypothetical protein
MQVRNRNKVSRKFNSQEKIMSRSLNTKRVSSRGIFLARLVSFLLARKCVASLLLISLALLPALVPTAEVASTRQAGQNSCASVVTERISCDLKGGYIYTFTVTNNSGGDVQQILLTPPTGSTITLSQQVFNLSPALHNTQSTSITVNIGNVTPGAQTCFLVTLMSNERPCCTIRVCPVLPDCCANTSTVSIRCNGNGSYTYVLSIVNSSPNTIQNIYLHPPSGVTMTPSYFAVLLAPGGTFQTPPITITGAQPGNLSFHISLHTADMKECCSVNQQITLPECGSTMACANGVCCARAPIYDGTKFTGQKIAAVTGWSQNNVLTVFDLSGANAFGLNVNNAPSQYNGPATSQWTLANLGSIFGVAIDHLGNIYVTASSAYNNDSYPHGSGRIYKIANGTGAISDFNAVPLPNSLDTSVNSFPALGNISFDCVHKQFFVTNLEDGKIYRLDMNGSVVSTFDHGVPDNGAPGFAPLGERLWAVKVHNGRVYYSVWKEDCGNHNPIPAVKDEVWSVGLNNTTGNFNPGDDKLEVTIPDLAGTDFSNPSSDISFSPDGKMLVAERTMLSSTAPNAHASRVLEYLCTSSGWVLAPAISGSLYKFNLGLGASSQCPVSGAQPANAAGGVDYDYDPAAKFGMWATGDHLQNPPLIYGLQGFPLAGGTVTNSALLALYGIGAFKTEIGDVAVSCPPGGNPY